ncbi:MAG: bifunctional (p)ppGpp synthetase/guanosine-3',5'-bis(diphosphate) 3'-pyrophosphohydrolase [Chloroflexota bacterium]|nr:bifunctional (p)ppGpp synthetase/guanosine-3',5'-bis(diphosphate) 3'-pyrophosphohydrolase [Chloroflexota bacterium]
MVVDELLAKAREYIPEERISVIDEAYRFAEKAHHGQLRLSGEPFIDHPLQTALFLAELKLDASALSAAILHDVIEDCHVSTKEIEHRFGSEIAGLVDGVTKLTKTELLTEKFDFELSDSADSLAHAASVRKMLVTMSEDIRVVLIKLSDRLHNMRTLKSLPKDRRIVIAQETLDIYAPLAHRLGIWELKWRLEDLAFQHLDPDAYRSISSLLNTKRVDREQYINNVVKLLDQDLDNSGISAEITGRPKHIYSIHKKIKNYAIQNKEIEEIYDLFALRIVVDDEPGCYAALGVVHTKWRPLPGQFDDYIANPKDNLYQSIHTTVLCEGASPVEVQIRTHDMHKVSEYGIAAHWLYKENAEADTKFDQKMRWLRQLLDWQREVTGAEEFVESFKTDVFQDQVFVYTPKGDLKELPYGSTPLDFAYRVHTDVGHRCIGAKVNGKLVPLHYHLNNGDTVSIMTSKQMKGPSLDWLNSNVGYVKTASAREKVRQWFNKQERRTNIDRGKEIFQKQIRRLHISIREEELSEAANFKNIDEFFVALGSGTLTVPQLISRLSPQDKKVDYDNVQSVPSTSPASGIQVLGVGDLLTRMAKCCNPINGEKIIGYITRNRGITVHKELCMNIVAETERERLVPVNWGRTEVLYPVRIKLDAWDRVGLLMDVTSLVSGEGVNIASCVSEEIDDLSVISLTVFTKGIDQLSRLFSKLESVKGIVSVTRVSSG